jgi:hypothetical protein
MQWELESGLSCTRQVWHILWHIAIHCSLVETLQQMSYTFESSYIAVIAI